MRILGIDPGSRATGFAILEAGKEIRLVSHGVIRTRPGSGLTERLRCLHRRLSAVVEEVVPDEAAIEEVFTAANIRSALVLGQARAAALLAVGEDTQVFEYSARAVKKAVVGYGQADKQQVARMITTLLRLPAVPPQDAADAMAIGLCHLHVSATERRLRTAR